MFNLNWEKKSSLFYKSDIKSDNPQHSQKVKSHFLEWNNVNNKDFFMEGQRRIQERFIEADSRIGDLVVEHPPLPSPKVQEN